MQTKQISFENGSQLDHTWLIGNNYAFDQAWLLEESNQFLSMQGTLNTMNDNLHKIGKLVDIFSDYGNEIEQRILSTSFKPLECQQTTFNKGTRLQLTKRTIMDAVFFLKYASNLLNTKGAHPDEGGAHPDNINEVSDVKEEFSETQVEMQVESACKKLLSLIFLCLEECKRRKTECSKNIEDFLQNTVKEEKNTVEKNPNLSICSNDFSEKCDIAADLKTVAVKIKNMTDEVSSNIIENPSKCSMVSDIILTQYCISKNVFETEQPLLNQKNIADAFQNEMLREKNTLFFQDFLTNQVKNNINTFRKLIKTLENEIDNAYKIVVKVSNENADLKELLKEREGQLNASSTQILILTHERDTISKKLLQAEYQHKITLEELNNLHNRFMSISSDRQSLLEDNLKLKGTQNEDNKFYNNLDEENSKLQIILKKFQTELNTAYNNLYDQTEKTNSVSTELRNLENKHECLQREIATLSKEFQEQKQEVKIIMKENEEMKIIIQCKDHEQATLRNNAKSNELCKKDFEDQIFQHISENQKLKRDLMALKQLENSLKEYLNECHEKIEGVTQEKLHFEERAQHFEEKVKNLQVLHDKVNEKHDGSKNIIKLMILNFKTLFNICLKNQREIFKNLNANGKDLDSLLEIDINLLGSLSENIDAKSEQLENLLSSATHKFGLFFETTLQHIVENVYERKTYVNFVSHLSKILNCKEGFLIDKGEIERGVPEDRFSNQNKYVVCNEKRKGLHSESLDIVRNLNKLLGKVENIKNRNCSKKKLTKIFGIIKMLRKKVYKYKTSTINLKKKLSRFQKEISLLLKVTDLSLIEPLVTTLIHQTSDRKKKLCNSSVLSTSSIFLKYVNELKTVLCKLIVVSDIAIRKRNDAMMENNYNPENKIYPEMLSHEINSIEKSIQRLYSFTNHYERISEFHSTHSINEYILNDANKECEKHPTPLSFEKKTQSISNNHVQSNDCLFNIYQSNLNNDIKNGYFKLQSHRDSELFRTSKDICPEVHPGFTKLKCIIEEKSYVLHIDNLLQKLDELSLILNSLENELFLTDDDKSYFKKHFKQIQAYISDARYELFFLRQHFEVLEKYGLATLQETYLKRTLHRNFVKDVEELHNLKIQEKKRDTNVVEFYIYEGKDRPLKNNFLNNSTISNSNKDNVINASCNEYSLKYFDESKNHFDLDCVPNSDSEISHSNSGTQATTSRIARTISTQEATELIKSVNRPTRYFDETRVHSPLRSPRADKNKKINNPEPYANNHAQTEDLNISASISPRAPGTQISSAEQNNNILGKQCYEMQRIRGRREIMFEVNKSDKKSNKDYNNESTLNENKFLENICDEKFLFLNKKMQSGSFILKGSSKHEVRETSYSFPKRSVKNATNSVSNDLIFDDFPQDELVSPFLNNSYVAKKKKNKFLNFYRK